MDGNRKGQWATDIKETDDKKYMRIKLLKRIRSLNLNISLNLTRNTSIIFAITIASGALHLGLENVTQTEHEAHRGRLFLV